MYGSKLSYHDEFLFTINPEWYYRSKVDIVTETILDEDAIHLTEKTFKAIYLGRPFVISASKGHLKALRDMGFKTFNSVINEDYDDMGSGGKISKVIDSGGKKIAYLMYNQFLGLVESENKDYNSELNDVFSNFLSNGAEELVIDLRYNPGGRISTSINLASMITGQFNNQVFAKERWNSKLMNYWNENSPESLLNKFTNKLENNQSIASLNLNRVFVLTSARTASKLSPCSFT